MSVRKFNEKVLPNFFLNLTKCQILFLKAGKGDNADTLGLLL